MKKITVLIVILLNTVFLLCSCGKSYICKSCEKSTTKAYYDMRAKKDRVLCEECAQEYWMPLDYKQYRVK